MYKKILFLLALLLIPITTTATIFPTGRSTEGDLTITGSRNEITNSATIDITSAASAGDTSTEVSSTTGFATGRYILITEPGAGIGNFEVKKISSIVGSDLSYTEQLVYDYSDTGAQVTLINEYHDVTIESGGSWTSDVWDDSVGGVLVAIISGTLSVETGGEITVEGVGDDGGTNGGASAGTGCSGSGAAGGGGGGNDTAGSAGGTFGLCYQPGAGGLANAGDNDVTVNWVIGAGGGNGHGVNNPARAGGKGGGLILLLTGNDIILVDSGSIKADGADGDPGTGGGGGGGAGGTIYLVSGRNVTLATTGVTSTGGSGSVGANAGGGTGGVGRIGVNDSAVVTGTGSPTINEVSTNTIYNLDQDAIQINLGISF